MGLAGNGDLLTGELTLRRDISNDMDTEGVNLSMS
jgi:hypothetical protein